MTLPDPSPDPLTGPAESRVRASFAAQTASSAATRTPARGRTIVVTRGEVHALNGGDEPRLIAAMQATMMAVAPPSTKPDVPAT